MHFCRSLILLFSTLLAVLPCAVTLAWGDGVLRLKETVEITAATYTLEDIVTLEGFPEEQKGLLERVDIGQTPRPGQWMHVTQTQIAAVLENVSPGITRKIQWQGPGFVRIRGGGVRCDRRALKQSALCFLQHRLREQYDDVSVRLVGEPRPVITTAGRVSFHPKMSRALRLRKRMPVWVDIHVEGEHFQTLPLWFDVSVQMPVWVVQRNLDPKAPMTADSVKKSIRDIAGLDGEPLRKASLDGLRTVRPLAQGKILTTDDVAPIPAVSRGDVITVIAGHGMVRLWVKAVALADGTVSQLIDVQNPNSGESFRATVIGTKKAMVN
jgi:flagella basal body P-ring formation protein FlgA